MAVCIDMGEHFKKAYELLNLQACKISTLEENDIFQSMYQYGYDILCGISIVPFANTTCNVLPTY